VALFRDSMVVVNWTPLSGIETRVVPNYSPFDPIRVEALESPTGIHVLVEVAERELSFLTPTRILSVLSLCESDLQCQSGYYCSERQICEVAVAPSAVAAPSGTGLPPTQGTSQPTQIDCVGSPPVSSAVCLNGVWVINQTITFNATAPLVIPGPTLISGSLVLGNSSTLIITSGGSLTVVGCITLGGSLEATVSIPPQLSGPANVILINYPGGFCGGAPTRFSNTSITSNRALQPCEKEQAELVYGPTSLSVTLSVVKVEGCDSNDGTASLSAGAVAGIVVGVLAAVAVTIGAIWILRFKVIPAYKVDSKMKDMHGANQNLLSTRVRI
jgi:hypothetical protein